MSFYYIEFYQNSFLINVQNRGLYGCDRAVVGFKATFVVVTVR
jgi:hypothetical protein